MALPFLGLKTPLIRKATFNHGNPQIKKIIIQTTKKPPKFTPGDLI